MIPLILAILYKVLNSERDFLFNSWDSPQKQASKDTCVQPVPLTVTYETHIRKRISNQKSILK